MEHFDNVFDGVLVLRKYVDHVLLQEHTLMVWLKDGTVLREGELAILRMAGWSDAESGCWIYD